MTERTRTPIELEFARRFRAVRRRSGMPTPGFAALVGCSASMVSFYENSRRVPPMGRADQIARTLGYDGLTGFLTACHACVGRPQIGTVCGTCGLPELPEPDPSPAELRAYARLRETIRGGSA